jgi:hypothetical protein
MSEQVAVRLIRKCEIIAATVGDASFQHVECQGPDILYFPLPLHVNAGVWDYNFLPLLVHFAVGTYSVVLSVFKIYSSLVLKAWNST